MQRDIKRLRSWPQNIQQLWMKKLRCRLYQERPRSKSSDIPEAHSVTGLRIDWFDLFKFKAASCTHFCKIKCVTQTQLGLKLVRHSRIRVVEQAAILLDKRLPPYDTFPTACLGVCIIYGHIHLKLDLIWIQNNLQYLSSLCFITRQGAKGLMHVVVRANGFLPLVSALLFSTQFCKGKERIIVISVTCEHLLRIYQRTSSVLAEKLKEWDVVPQLKKQSE